MPNIDNDKCTIEFQAFELVIRDTNEGDKEVLQIDQAFNEDFIAKAREIGVKKVVKKEESIE